MDLKSCRISRKLIIAIASVGLIAVLTWGYARANSQHAYLKVGNLDSPVALYPFHQSIIDFGGGIEFCYNTGSFISTILPADLERLKIMGMDVDSVSFPSFGIDHLNKTFFCSKMYTVDRPVYDNQPGAKPENRRVVGRMKDVLFLPAPSSDTLSTLGIDVIERFVCLYSPATKAIGFSTEVPDGFQLLTDITSEWTVATLLGCGKRYYVDMSIENSPHSFFINTSFPKVNVVLPAKDSVLANSELRTSLLVTIQGSFRAKFLNKAWMNIGDRAGNHPVFFADTDFLESYVVNPMNFFLQDFVIDYPHNRILLRPRADLLPASSESAMP